jgi:hypothetical protein
VCDLASVDGPVVTNATRTLLDLGAEVPEATLRASLDEALRRRWTTLERLEAAVDRSAPRPGLRTLRLMVEELFGGGGPTDSELEAMGARAPGGARLRGAALDVGRGDESAGGADRRAPPGAARPGLPGWYRRTPVEWECAALAPQTPDIPACAGGPNVDHPLLMRPLVLLLTLLAASALAAPKRLAMPVGRTTTLSMSAPVSDVKVTNPALVDAWSDGRKVTFVARARGTTEVVVKTVDGEQRFSVYVAQDKYAMPY